MNTRAIEEFLDRAIPRVHESSGKFVSAVGDRMKYFLQGDRYESSFLAFSG